MSIKELNWRRGLFRMWIVLSITWVFGFAALTYTKYVEFVRVENQIKVFLEDDNLSDMKINETINIKQAEWNRKFSEKLKEKSLKNKSIDEILTEPADKELFDLTKSDKQLAELLKYSRLKKLTQHYAYLTIIPPIIFFVIGYALLWVLSGFLLKQQV